MLKVSVFWFGAFSDGNTYGNLENNGFLDISGVKKAALWTELRNATGTFAQQLQVCTQNSCKELYVPSNRAERVWTTQQNSHS